jgi:hypothetical protein
MNVASVALTLVALTPDELPIPLRERRAARADATRDTVQPGCA